MNYPELLEKIIKHGIVVRPRGEEVRELMHQQLEVDDRCIYHFAHSRELLKIKKYWSKEMAWYLSGDRGHEYISKHANMWRHIKNEDNTSNSNYGYLIFYHKTKHPSLDIETLTPFAWAARSLEQDKDSRQAVVTYNTGGYNYIGNKDYICTQHQAFYIRENVLYCYIALRSSDAIYGLAYNMPWWQFVYQMMLARLRGLYPALMPTSIIVTIYSAHIYQKHYELVNKMLQSKIKAYKMELKKIPVLGKPPLYYERMFSKMITIK